MIAGSYDYPLKVRTSDIKSYRMVLGERSAVFPMSLVHPRSS
jgi:hypothetical protein